MSIGIGKAYCIARRYFGKRSGFLDKTILSPSDAIKNIRPSQSVYLGGFGLCGVPETLLRRLGKVKGKKNLHVISNTGGTDDAGLGHISGQFSTLTTSYIGGNRRLLEEYLSGRLAIRFTPQGTLAERIRSAGAGIPAFFTPTAIGTDVAYGRIPEQYARNGRVVKFSAAREVREFGGRLFLMERSLPADVAFVHAAKADAAGNLVYHGAARNFNSLMARAAKWTVAEVDEIVPTGSIPPDAIHTPGIFVNALVRNDSTKKRNIERWGTLDGNGHVTEQGVTPERALIREKIARRVALELKPGQFVNLGIGIPVLTANYLPDGVVVQSENGVLGIGPFPSQSDNADPDVINAGKEPVTLIPGASTFGSDDAFDMIRGGHLDVTVLGGMQVSAYGDLSNWAVPGGTVRGFGGAMDLANSRSSTSVIVAMEHCTRKGDAKILEQCTFPLTARNVVHRIITDKAVFSVHPHEGLCLEEIAEDSSLADITQHTGCAFSLSSSISLISP